MKINNTDIQTTYQTHLLDTNYKDLLCYPPLKKLPSNEWAEYYGKEYDTTTPILDTQQYTLTFICKATHYAPFITFLTAQTYNDFHFEELGKTFRLRFVSAQKAKTEQGYITTDITLANDTPLQGYTTATSLPITSVPPTGFTIDGTDIAKYGIYLLEENQNTLLPTYEVKEHLTTTSTTLAGVQYAQHQNTFQERTLTLHCYISQPITTFWQLYQALLYNLTKQGERTIIIPPSFAGGGTLNAIYQKASINNVFLVTDTIKAAFTITMAVVQ